MLSLNIQKLLELVNAQLLGFGVLSNIGLDPLFLVERRRFFSYFGLGSLQSLLVFLLVLDNLRISLGHGFSLGLVGLNLGVSALNSGPTNVFGNHKQTEEPTVVLSHALSFNFFH